MEWVNKIPVEAIFFYGHRKESNIKVNGLLDDATDVNFFFFFYKKKKRRISMLTLYVYIENKRKTNEIY